MIASWLGWIIVGSIIGYLLSNVINDSIAKLISHRKSEQFTEVTAANNWDGIPVSDLTWKEVREGAQSISPIIPMTLPVIPERCPVCSGMLTEYKSDWQVYEGDTGQYDVVGKYCAKGHWTHLSWA